MNGGLDATKTMYTTKCRPTVEAFGKWSYDCDDVDGIQGPISLVWSIDDGYYFWNLVRGKTAQDVATNPDVGSNPDEMPVDDYS